MEEKESEDRRLDRTGRASGGLSERFLFLEVLTTSSARHGRAGEPTEMGEDAVEMSQLVDSLRGSSR